MTAISDSNGIPRLGYVDDDKNFCPMVHGSPSCVRLGSDYPSNPRMRRVG
jgi:hypothetical protein